MRSPDPPKQPSGLPMALGAYVVWGLMPLYLVFVRAVPPFEFVGWRIVFTVPLCLAIIHLRGQWRELRQIFANRRILAMLLVSALLVATNWLVYVAAVMDGHVLATSLGYYINPLLTILLGRVFLKEPLNSKQWLAVILAGLGVSLLAWEAREMMWISLVLALSFAAYGLVRRLVPVGSVPGLTVETIVLLAPAIAVVWWYAIQPAGSAFGHHAGQSLAIAFAGVMTAVPLMLFAVAARRMDFTVLGFTQFLSPTIVFVLGVAVFGEPLRPVQLACFVLIWGAIGLFVWDLLKRRSAT